MRTLKSWLLITICVSCTGCLLAPGCSPTGGGSGNRLVIPENLDLDIDEFPDDATDPDNAAPAARPFDSANERACAAGGAVVYGFGRLLNRGLALAAAINDDVTDPVNPFVEGTFMSPTGEVGYKADFSAFDIDGDGDADGSGRYDTTPVAIRMWVTRDGTTSRFLCALITTRATGLNAGAGELYLQPGVAHVLVNPDFRVHVTWDRTGSDYRWTQAFTVGTLRRNVSVSAAHHLVEHLLLEDGSVQKTVRSTAAIEQSDYDFTQMQFAARTVVDAGAGVLNVVGAGAATVSLENSCVSLPTCAAAGNENCTSIEVTDISYLAAPSGLETDWPAAFPEQPTF